MVERDVNPLAGRQMALAVRFKAAWAFHQLLVGMQRTQILEEFDDRTEAFKSAFEKLKAATDKLEGPETSETGVIISSLDALEVEVKALIGEMARADESISASQLRRFFQRVRSFDERILIDIVRFYQLVEGVGAWEKDRLDKVDLVISRLAESIAGPELEGDRTRLRKVLQALAVPDAAGEGDDAAEITSLSATLQDLRSEVRWVKTFEELHDSKLVQLYRALKHDMGHKLFHPNLLPLVADANNAFKLKIDELRGAEEDRIVSGYRQLLQGPEQPTSGGPELNVALAGLQRQLDDFQARAKAENVRLDELARLGQNLRAVRSRFQDRLQASGTEASAGAVVASTPRRASTATGTEALLPNLDAVRPFWDELVGALGGLAPELDPEAASTRGAVLEYRLEPREVTALHAIGDETRPAHGVDHFIVAAVAMRRRISSVADEIQGALSEAAGTTADSVLESARRTIRMADAYLKHFSHLVDHAVFEGDLEAARSYQGLQMRFMREHSGLLNLIPRLSAQASLSEVEFPVESGDQVSLAAGGLENRRPDQQGD